MQPTSNLSSAPSESARPMGMFLTRDLGRINDVWAPALRARLEEFADILPGNVTEETLPAVSRLAEVEVIFSTWKMPLLTAEQLDAMPKLRAVFYAAGTVKYFAEPLLERGITVVSAWAANAIPVAEFSLAQILFSLKLGWRYIVQLQANPSRAGWKKLPMPGIFDSTVGIISLGMIGRELCELLTPFRLRKIAYDPFADASVFDRYGVESATLETIFSQSDVVTLHSPWLKETEGMITGKLLASMKPNATFLNTSRGALVREDELIAVLRDRPDLTAILDVTYPEPPVDGSPLYSLPNVILTPHIAGSGGREVWRMAEYMIEECQAWKDGRPLRYAVSRDMLDKIA